MRISGSIWVILALVAASLEPILVKLGYRGPVTCVQLLVLKNLTGALLIVPLTRTCRLISWAEARPIALVSLLLFATNALTLLALKTLSAVIVITCLTATPAVVALANQSLGRDKLTARFWAGLLTCIGGIILTLDFSQAAIDPFGLCFILTAVLTSTVYRVRMESVTATFPPALVSTYIFLLNGVVTAAFILPFMGSLPPSALPLGVWLGAVAALANVAFLFAIKSVGSTRISVILMLERPILILLAAFILKEQLTLVELLGIALVFIGTRTAQVKRRLPGSPEPAATEPDNLICIP